MTTHLAAHAGRSWSDAGKFEVAPGVHRVPLPLPNDSLKAVNVYVLADGEEVTLIDAGWGEKPQARAALEAGLRTLDLGLSDIDRFLVTHVHRDHYTLGVVLRREFGTHLSLGAGERPVLEMQMDADADPLAGQLAHMRRCGAGELVDKLLADPFLNGPRPRGAWAAPDSWLQPGALPLRSGRILDVVETPGHTSGHVVFHDEAAGLLFAGDHVLPTITPSLGFEAIMSPSPLGDYLASLARVRALPDARLLPAHGPVTASSHARIDELLVHHDDRLAKTAAALAQGAHTPVDAARILGWTRRERRLDELDVFNQMLAISETHAHLTVLVSQGRATSRLEDGVLHYLQA
jgi:glyoxylase-like metal-dependent hydrolase (beta-lactamase superfamily II)